MAAGLRSIGNQLAGLDGTVLMRLPPELFQVILAYCHFIPPPLKPSYEAKSTISPGESQMHHPTGLALDGGNLFVGDTATVKVWDLHSGTLLRQLEPPTAFSDACSLTFDTKGNLHVADFHHHCIHMFDPTGDWEGSYNPAEGHQLRSPIAVTLNHDGTILVSDYDNRQIQIFTDAGQPLARWPTDCKPLGTAVFPNSDIIVCDYWGHKMKIFDQKGVFLREFGKRGEEPGSFVFPNGVLTDRDGNIVVIEQSNNRLSLFDPSGQIKRILGLGQLNRPQHAVLDPQGNIMVTDQGNHRIVIFG